MIQAPPINRTQAQLVRWTLANSGIICRDYLDMAAIGHCSRRLYFELTQGRERSSRTHHLSYLGQILEADVLLRLYAIDAAALGPAQTVADFHGQFRGTTQGTWQDDLLVIKTGLHDKLPKAGLNLPRLHEWHVQTLLHYTGHRQATVIYVARDTGYLQVVEVRANERIGESARLKAASILEYAAVQRTPECECDYCKI